MFQLPWNTKKLVVEFTHQQFAGSQLDVACNISVLIVSGQYAQAFRHSITSLICQFNCCALRCAVLCPEPCSLCCAVPSCPDLLDSTQGMLQQQQEASSSGSAPTWVTDLRCSSMPVSLRACHSVRSAGPLSCQVKGGLQHWVSLCQIGSVVIELGSNRVATQELGIDAERFYAEVKPGVGTQKVRELFQTQKCRITCFTRWVIRL